MLQTRCAAAVRGHGSYRDKNLKLCTQNYVPIVFVGTKTLLRVATPSSLYSRKSCFPRKENSYYPEASACVSCHGKKKKKWPFVQIHADTSVWEQSSKSYLKSCVPSYLEGQPVIMFDVCASPCSSPLLPPPTILFAFVLHRDNQE